MRILIITGGSVCSSAAEIIREYDPEWTIAADYGIHHAFALGIRPDMILGDFDSIDPKELELCEGIDRVTFPPEKDYTDTELALEAALEKVQGTEDRILLLGAMGTRADHSLANIFLLKRAADLGITCEIADDHNRIRMLKGPVQHIVTAGYPNISLLPMFGDAIGITLKGFYYPLDRTTIPAGRAWGVSNELVEPTGWIELEQGYMLVIEASDTPHKS